MNAVIDRNGQVVIPDEVREQLGLSTGSVVAFKVDEQGRAYLQKSQDLAERVEAVRGMVGTLDLGMTSDEFMALIRGDD